VRFIKENPSTEMSIKPTAFFMELKVAAKVVFSKRKRSLIEADYFKIAKALAKELALILRSDTSSDAGKWLL